MQYCRNILLFTYTAAVHFSQKKYGVHCFSDCTECKLENIICDCQCDCSCDLYGAEIEQKSSRNRAEIEQKSSDHDLKNEKLLERRLQKRNEKRNERPVVHDSVVSTG